MRKRAEPRAAAGADILARVATERERLKVDVLVATFGQFEGTGEVRIPRAGEHFLWINNTVVRAHRRLPRISVPILRRVRKGVSKAARR